MAIIKINAKKNGKQGYRVRVSYMDQEGNRKQPERTVYGMDEAKLMEMRMQKEIAEKAMPTKRMTLQELYDEYCAVRQAEVRETTLDKFQRVAMLHVIPALGKYKLDKITPQILNRWKIEIEKKGLALKTKQGIYATLRPLFTYSIRMGYLTSNPLDKVGNFKSSSEFEKEMDYYTAEEFQQFIQAARERAGNTAQHNSLINWDYYVFFAIAFYTGLRKGEIHGLQWNDIQDGFLSVKRSIAQKLKGGDRETPPKNKSSVRTLQLPLPLIKILDEHKNRWKQADGFQESYKVCGGTKSLRDSSLTKRNEAYAAAAGVKKIRIHDFRHSHASLLANAGINIQEIARRLGHSNVEITWNTYSHLYPKEEERAVAILNTID